jgi:WD40 repeat protein
MLFWASGCTISLQVLIAVYDGCWLLVNTSVPLRIDRKMHLSGSVGGDICVWRAEGFWEHVKGMKGHRDIVNSMSAHPSGKLSLSVSRDKQMRLWDLTKGSCAYQAALGCNGDIVGFFQGGDMYYVSSSDPSAAKGSKVSLHSIQVSVSPLS